MAVPSPSPQPQIQIPVGMSSNPPNTNDKKTRRRSDYPFFLSYRTRWFALPSSSLPPPFLTLASDTYIRYGLTSVPSSSTFGIRKGATTTNTHTSTTPCTTTSSTPSSTLTSSSTVDSHRPSPVRTETRSVSSSRRFARCVLPRTYKTIERTWSLSSVTLSPRP